MQVRAYIVCASAVLLLLLLQQLAPAAAVMPGSLASSFLGGSGEDGARAATLDTAGNVIVVAWTQSSTLPVVGGAAYGSNGPSVLYVAKFDAAATFAASSLHWSSYVGGSGDEGADRSSLNHHDDLGLAVDDNDDVYLCGSTSSTDFPDTLTTGYSGGASDGFVMKLNGTSGAMEWARMLGGVDEDAFSKCVVNSASRSLYAVGWGASNSTSLAGTPGAHRTSCVSCAPGFANAFVARFDADSGSMEWMSFYDHHWEVANSGHNLASIVITLRGTPAVIGSLVVGDIESVNCGSGGQKTYILEFEDAAGTVIPNSVQASLWCGTDPSTEGLRAYGAAVDSVGRLHVAGFAGGAGSNYDNIVIPQHAYQQARVAGDEAFYMILTPQFQTVQYFTFFGGLGHDSFTGISIGHQDVAVLVGQSTSPDLPVTQHSPRQATGASMDTFLAVFSTGDVPALQQLDLFGGDTGPDMFFQVFGPTPKEERIIAVGRTGATTWPTTAAVLQEIAGGQSDGMMVSFLRDPVGADSCSDLVQCPEQECTDSACSSSCDACCDWITSIQCWLGLERDETLGLLIAAAPATMSMAFTVYQIRRYCKKKSND